MQTCSHFYLIYQDCGKYLNRVCKEHLSRFFDALCVMFSDNKTLYPERPVDSTSGHTIRRRERRLHHIEDVRQ